MFSHVMIREDSAIICIDLSIVIGDIRHAVKKEIGKINLCRTAYKRSNVCPSLNHNRQGKRSHSTNVRSFQADKIFCL